LQELGKYFAGILPPVAAAGTVVAVPPQDHATCPVDEFATPRKTTVVRAAVVGNPLVLAAAIAIISPTVELTGVYKTFNTYLDDWS